MRRIGLLAAALLGAAAMLTGCGGGGPAGHPAASRVPLARGVHVVSRVRRCDRGRHAYCGVQLVVVGSRYRDSMALRDAQMRRLRDAGWAADEGETDHESAAESPNGRLRLTYATAAADLQSLDLGTIERARPIALGLSDAMFARAAALSLVVQTGSS